MSYYLPEFNLKFGNAIILKLKIILFCFLRMKFVCLFHANGGNTEAALAASTSVLHWGRENVL